MNRYIYIYRETRCLHPFLNVQVLGGMMCVIRQLPGRGQTRPSIPTSKHLAVAEESFIELQDKLHQNICRRRTLVAWHDPARCFIFWSDCCWGRRPGWQEVDTHYCYGSFSSGCWCYSYNYNYKCNNYNYQNYYWENQPFLSTIINISSEHFAMSARSHRVWNSLCRISRIERTVEDMIRKASMTCQWPQPQSFRLINDLPSGINYYYNSQTIQPFSDTLLGSNIKPIPFGTFQSLIFHVENVEVEA